MLMRTDPFREFDRLAQQVLGAGTTSRPAVMPMDAWRQGDAFVIEFDLPGVASDGSGSTSRSRMASGSPAGKGTCA